MTKESIDFYVSHVDEMIKQAHAENNMSLLSILYTLKGSLLSNDIKELSHYVIVYAEDRLKYQQN